MRFFSSEKWKAFARWVPFPAMTLLVLALFVIGEQFPFSNFPMYSNIGTDAEVLYVTDQNDKPLPMKPCFSTSSASAKKTFRTELAKLTRKRGKGSDDATPAERAQAAREVMELLRIRLVKKALPAGTAALRVHVRTFRAGSGGIAEIPAELLAELKL